MKPTLKLLFLRLIGAVARLCSRRAAPPRPRRILVIKPDHLGDLLLATPALGALRAGLPGAHIAALVGPWSRRMWAGSPHIDLLLDLPFPGFDRATGPASAPARATARAARCAATVVRPYVLLLKYGLLLRRGRYDAALILRDDHWWGAALAALAGIPVRVGHAHPLCAPLLTAALPYDPRQHVTRQALAVVEAVAGGPGPEPPLRFAPPPADRAWAAAWLAEHLPPGERLVIIHPGTGGPAKHWPAGRWSALAERLSGLPGTRLLLTGGPGEAGLAAEVAAGVARLPLSLAGQTSPGQLAALLGRAALVLGVDSGPLHIAVSQGAPTIHLFGPSDHERFGPWGDPRRNLVLRAGLFCSPCGVFAACPRGTSGPECMAAIGVDEVFAAAAGLLGAAGSAGGAGGGA